MRVKLVARMLPLILLFLCGCVGASPVPRIAASQASRGQEASRMETQVTDAFTDSETLSYQGYVLEKRYKTVRLPYSPEMKEPPELVDVSYAVLKKRRKILAKFDGVYFGMGNSTRFGLFPFLGGETKQLFISQDIFRGGQQWIVSLSPCFRIIYDGSEYETGREADDLRVVDVDGDGVYEITQPLTAFYGMSGRLPPGRTPLPTVIFKYDARAKKYLPANRLFQDYLLKDIDVAKKRVSGPQDHISHLSDILHIVLDYIFAGKEQQAWTFYEEAYKLPDKTQVRRDIKAILKTQPVYRLMYQRAYK